MDMDLASKKLGRDLPERCQQLVFSVPCKKAGCWCDIGISRPVSTMDSTPTANEDAKKLRPIAEIIRGKMNDLSENTINTLFQCCNLCTQNKEEEDDDDPNNDDTLPYEGD